MSVRQGGHERGLCRVGTCRPQGLHEKENRDVTVVFSHGRVASYSHLAQRTQELIGCAGVHLHRLKRQAEVGALGGLRGARTALHEVASVAVAEEGELQTDAFLL